MNFNVQYYLTNDGVSFNKGRTCSFNVHFHSTTEMQFHSAIDVDTKKIVCVQCHSLQLTATHVNLRVLSTNDGDTKPKRRRLLQLTATHCNSLQRTWMCGCIQRLPQLTATHCNSLQLTATQENVWFHSTNDLGPKQKDPCLLQLTATHCNPLQHTSMCCFIQ